MRVLEGGCHCGAARYAFRTALDPLPMRSCTCSFCSKHGARTASDPAGHVEIRLTEDVTRYRFDQLTADFLVCSVCGVYVAALLEGEGREVATININTLDVKLTGVGASVSYADEEREQRVKRRLAAWTPATVVG
jgi:hypothetical protein